MSCENCRDIEEVDGVIPVCRGMGGDIIPGVTACPIPPLSPDEARVLEIRAKLITLKDLIPAETVLKLYGATMEDIEMLAAVEEELNEMGDEKGNKQPQQSNS